MGPQIPEFLIIIPSNSAELQSWIVCSDPNLSFLILQENACQGHVLEPSLLHYYRTGREVYVQVGIGVGNI